jgi:phosphate starvation-inducible PhoH-like protein
MSNVAVELALEPVDNERLANLCGQFDEHLRLLERRTGVEIGNRGNQFKLRGPDDDVVVTERVIRQLYSMTATKTVSPEDVHLELKNADIEADDPSSAAVRIRRGSIRPRGTNQRRYLEAIRSHDISFGIGPAGTGKTYLAVACAVAALEADSVRQIGRAHV